MLIRAWTLINVTINRRKEKESIAVASSFSFVLRENNTLTTIVCRRLERMWGNNCKYRLE